MREYCYLYWKPSDKCYSFREFDGAKYQMVVTVVRCGNKKALDFHMVGIDGLDAIWSAMKVGVVKIPR